MLLVILFNPGVENLFNSADFALIGE